MNDGSSSRLAYIDGWRTIAVSLVIIAHLGNNQEIGQFYKNSWIGYFAEFGEQGVLIFFYIIGYVVSRTCINEVNTQGSFSIQSFYIRRIFRIVPPLIIYLTTCYILGIKGLIKFSQINFWSSASYLCNSTLLDCGWYGGHTWSLAFEEQFYLIFPIFFAWKYARQSPNLLWTLGVVAIAIIPFIFQVVWIGKTGFVIIYMLFFAGYLSAKKCAPPFVNKNWLSSVIIIASAILIFLPLDIIFKSFDINDINTRLLIGKYYKFVYIAAIPTLVSLTAIKNTFLIFILGSKVLSYLGKATYSIYLWQQLVTGPELSGIPVIAQLLLVVVMAVFCVSMYELVEKKMTNIGRRISVERGYNQRLRRYIR
jgi:peptidoglycan/LPS O-acetylase OafA/YrhL